MPRSYSTRIADSLAGLFDRLEHNWENRRTVAGLANFLIFIFLLELGLFELKRLGLCAMLFTLGILWSYNRYAVFGPPACRSEN